jgi:hypothetical protein
LLRRSAARGVVGETEPARPSPPVPARNSVRSHSPRLAQVSIGRLGLKSIDNPHGPAGNETCPPYLATIRPAK